MTITYSLAVANTRFCGFAKLLVKWKGSIYKILWKEFLIFCIGYSAISVTYRYFLNAYQKESFEKVVLFVESYTDLIPLSFVLGFYVSLVVGRWWAQYDAIPWPDRLCLMIGAYVHGADERSRMIRRTLARYLILLQALTFQAVSTSVKRRFPTTHHLVAAGMMTKEEQTVYEKINFVYGKWWMPCQWFSSLLMRAKKEGRIKDSILLDALFRELLIYRNSCGTMLSYDWISVPLVYTQVVTLATYMYAASLVIGRQYLDTSKDYARHQVDLYIPFFTILQFIFYVGWLKVAEQIVNPYGEDDDDFELNWCLDRTVHVVYLLVDHLQTKHPKVRRDYFWDEVEPRLPQTKHSAKGIENPQQGSAFNLEVECTKYLPMDTFLEQDKEDNIYSSDSVRHSSISRLRSSFIMKILRPAVGQSFRKASLMKDDAAKNSLQYRGYINSAYVPSNDKSGRSTPEVSRKSSSRSTLKRVSPSHSRTSSTSVVPNCVGLRRLKSYDSQEAVEKLYGNIQDPDGSVVQDNELHLKNIHVGQFDEMISGTEDKFVDTDLDTNGMRSDIPMPSIPEEPSRADYFACIDCKPVKGQEFEPQLENVQSFMKEANEVLRELNRTISIQGHRADCELKGYETCCSFSSDMSSDDTDNDTNNIEQSKSNELATMVQDILSNEVNV